MYYVNTNTNTILNGFIDLISEFQAGYENKNEFHI